MQLPRSTRPAEARQARAITFPLSPRCAPSGPRPQTSLPATFSASCCSCRCAATKPRACAGREVDLDQGRIRIAAQRMKAREAHELPLSPAASAIIEARRLTRVVVRSRFPSSEDTPFTNWTRLLARIRKTIGEDKKDRTTRASIHDFRRGFVSHLAERGFDIDLLDQCLGHRRAGVLGIYQRSSRMADRAARAQRLCGAYSRRSVR